MEFVANSNSQPESGNILHRIGVICAQLFIDINTDIIMFEGILYLFLAIFVYFKYNWISQIESMTTFLVMLALYGIFISMIAILKGNFISKKRPGLILFFSVLVIFFTFMVKYILGNYIVENKEIVKEFITTTADKFYAEDEQFRQMWKTFENQYECCGIKKTNFLKLLISCPTKVRACSDVIEGMILMNANLFLTLFWFYAILQFIDFLLSVYLCFCYFCIFKYKPVLGA